MRVDLPTVARVLSSIAQPPGLRSTPQVHDLKGEFESWFDGGAIKNVTGWSEYHFADGSVAIVPTTPHFHVDVRLPNGRYVSISEQSSTPPNFVLLNGRGDR